MSHQSPAKILVVDDETDFLFYICKILKQAGYHVLIAENGEQAWQLFQAEQPQLVLTDLVMPEKSGYELARLIRGSPHPETPIISLTGFPFRDDMTRGDSKLVDLYLTKPIQNADLLTAIGICLDKMFISP